MMGFPDSSVGKESACNTGDPCSIPGSGRSPGEGIGHPLQYSWASLVAQLVKNLSAMWRPGFDPWVGKIPWKRERPPTPVFWPGKFMDCIVHGVAKSQTQLNKFKCKKKKKIKDNEQINLFLMSSKILNIQCPSL